MTTWQAWMQKFGSFHSSVSAQAPRGGGPACAPRRHLAAIVCPAAPDLCPQLSALASRASCESDSLRKRELSGARSTGAVFAPSGGGQHQGCGRINNIPPYLVTTSVVLLFYSLLTHWLLATIVPPLAACANVVGARILAWRDRKNFPRFTELQFLSVRRGLCFGAAGSHCAIDAHKFCTLRSYGHGHELNEPGLVPIPAVFGMSLCIW